MNDQLIGVLLGGVLATMGTLVVSLTVERRGRLQWRREEQLKAARDAVAALQHLNRKMINTAMAPTTAIDGVDAEWHKFHAATIEWNTARFAASLVSPTPEVALLNEIHRELDSLLGRATSKSWLTRDFRIQRARLGTLGAEYLRAARTNAGEGQVEIGSLWSWEIADDVSREHNAQVYSSDRSCAGQDDLHG